MKLLSKAQVNKLREPLRINHDILWLEVAEDDIVGMQMTDGVKYSCDIEHGSVVIKAAVPG